jgi:hypothetical protein
MNPSLQPPLQMLQMIQHRSIQDSAMVFPDIGGDRCLPQRFIYYFS